MPALATTSRFPLVLIAGFLGAGKTTLIQRILQHPGGRRIALIVNDIGEINIDAELIKTRDADQISLTNGCICCSLKSDLFESVLSLSKGNSAFDAIVVEASGLAEPASLVHSIKLLEEARLAFTDTIAYLIDTSAFASLDYEEAEHVLDSAGLCDLTVLNKCDIATDAQLNQLTDELSIMAPDAVLYKAEQANVPLDMLFAPAQIIDSTPKNRNLSDSRSKFSGDDYRHLSIETGRYVDKEALMAFVDAASEICWRIKGFVLFQSDPTTPQLLQVVNRRAMLEPYKALANQQSKLVFIGRVDLFDEELLRSGFERCLR